MYEHHAEVGVTLRYVSPGPLMREDGSKLMRDPGLDEHHIEIEEWVS
jgi:hypothetical protein